MEVSPTLGSPAREVRGSTGAVDWLVLGLGVVGALALVLAEFSLTFQVDTLTSGTCQELADAAVRDRCRATGLEQHSGALILLGLFAAAMAVGAGRRASRPAAVALIAMAAVAFGIAVFIDLPKTRADGLLEPFYESGEARPGAGFYLEWVGAGLCLCAGALRLLRPRSGVT